MIDINRNKSLLSGQNRIQVPWIKVTIGDYTFGAFDEKTKKWYSDNLGAFDVFSIQYPQYVSDLNIIKINGQVNTYSLSLNYPVTQFSDPNFFEKVFSSVSRTRKIVFTYGDAESPGYTYKDEEAIITDVTQTFNLEGSVISYQVKAISSAALTTDGSITKPAPSIKVKPSDEIKKLFLENKSLQNTFTGMNINNLNELIAGDDAAVKIESKQNISALDYINYLTSCMIPAGSENGLSKDIYVLTIIDDSVSNANKAHSQKGPYFQVTKVSTTAEHSDAYEIDIGIQTSTIVRSLNIENHANYSIYYEFQNLAHPENFARRIGSDGLWEDVYAPTSMARNSGFETHASDKAWWAKATQFPINATIQVQGLLRPATLMQYVRLNIIFPGGKKHLLSGLYIVTKQFDSISPGGYITTLSMTRINGDTSETFK
jgi:hypothetical protein